jgi:hypothetical protein
MVAALIASPTTHATKGQTMLKAIPKGAGRQAVDDPTLPITAAFGRHKGLSADWNCRAWHIRHGLTIVDNEDGETVSLIAHHGCGGERHETALATGTAHQVLAFCRMLIA